MNSFFTLHRFLEVGKTQDLPSKFCQTLGDALTTATTTEFIVSMRFKVGRLCYFLNLSPKLIRKQQLSNFNLFKQ
jgi:hypothetical protein